MQKQLALLPSPISSSEAQLGFTMIELMVVVAIVATLTALAAPMFTPMVERWRVRGTTEEMTSTLYFARGEAIKRGGGVTIGKLNNSGACTRASTNEDWGCGWIVFVDTDGDGNLDPGELILQTAPEPANTNVVIPGSGGSIALNRWGTFNGIGATGIRISPAAKTISDPSSAAICVASGGRIRTTTGTGIC